MRGKSSRNGVHRSNAVVWAPVYRTHLVNFAQTPRPRRASVAAVRVGHDDYERVAVMVALDERRARDRPPVRGGIVRHARRATRVVSARLG